jgi:hypothetical protein
MRGLDGEQPALDPIAKRRERGPPRWSAFQHG